MPGQTCLAKNSINLPKTLVFIRIKKSISFPGEKRSRVMYFWDQEAGGQVAVPPCEVKLI